MLVSADELTPEYRWRLVASLLNQTRSLFEDGLSLTVVLGICFARTRWSGFAVLMGASALLGCVRLAQARGFRNQTKPAPGAVGPAATSATEARAADWQTWEERWPRGPDKWARQFMLSVAMFSLLWGAADLCAFLLFDDPLMQMFVVVVQSLWVGASTVRNAASPAAMYAQVVLTSMPTIAGAAISHSPLILMLVPFLLIQYGSIRNAARYTGRQIASMLLSDQRLEAANARLTELSATDGLTGIGNRRAFDSTLQTEWGRAARDATDLALLVIDVDHFKSFNDRYGHPAGDDCLRLIAEVTQRTLRRPPDFAARFGGEEFVALLPGTDEVGAREVAQRVRLAVLDACMAHEGNPIGYVTISIGAASMAPRPGDVAQKLIDLADRALYSAKQYGRNQVRAVSDGMTLGPWIAAPAAANVPEGRNEPR
jgi:diguanylate cyclase (GGDEF)-like protein